MIALSQRAAVAWVVAGLLWGCSQQNSDSELVAPSQKDFAAVSSVLERRCGGLDCHGSPARNLRIHGIYGLRLDGRDSTGGADTTDAEVIANYVSVLSIDPETLSRVTASQGAGEERWLLLSKGRQREAHVGGARLSPGTPADNCVISWLAGKVDVGVCAEDSFGPIPREGDAW